MEELIRIELPYACAGVILRNGIVVDAAPIFKWMIGRPIDVVYSWVGYKKGTLLKLDKFSC